MRCAIIGLGKMGAAIAARLRKEKYCVLGYDPSLHAQEAMEKLEVQLYTNLPALAQEADVIWLMIPAGPLIDQTIAALGTLRPGVIIVDGGNSNFNDSRKRAAALAQKKIPFLDCGTSGGVHGQEHGFCLMVGGDYHAYQAIEPLLKVIAMKDGYGYMGPSGAGHYVKMVHNGIEYGLLQAYAEGFDLLRNGDYKDLDLEKISRVWLHGAVIRSWLLELAHDIFKEDQMFGSVSGAIQEGGTGAWTVENAHKNKVLVPVIATSLEVREWSRKTGGNFATKLIALLRHAFGGHAVVRKNENI